MDQIRVATLNLWGEQPPLAERMEEVIAACAALELDAICLQEVREVPGSVPNMAATIAEALGFQHAFAPATPWGGGVEGLAICSRLPIAHQEFAELPHAVESERRVVLAAVVEAERTRVALFTTHLNYRLADGAKREDQVAAIDAFIRPFPTELPRILCGDFNAAPGSDEIRFLRGQHSVGGQRTYWQDAWERHHPGERGYTWAARNPYTAKLAWLEPDRRIDYILVSPMTRDGRGVIEGCRMAFDQPSRGGVWCSDHFGLVADIRITPRG